MLGRIYTLLLEGDGTTNKNFGLNTIKLPEAAARGLIVFRHFQQRTCTLNQRDVKVLSSSVSKGLFPVVFTSCSVFQHCSVLEFYPLSGSPCTT